MPVEYSRLKPKGQPDLLSDEVPWRGMVAPGVVQQKEDYALQRSYQVRGPDLKFESDEVQGATILQAAEVFKRLGGEWTLHSEATRTRVMTLPPIAWEYDIPRLIDQARRQDLLEDRESRETVYTMTLTWVPPKPIIKRGLGFFVRGPGRPSAPTAPGAVSIREFVQQADFLMHMLRAMLAVCTPLSSAQTATYLNTCVNDTWHEVKDLDDWNNLDHQLCTTPVDPAGWYPELGKWHLRTLSISGYPAESMVGIMRNLERLNLDYRWVTRWAGMEQFVQQQFLKKAEAKWVNSEKSVFDRSMENFTGNQTRVIDPDATNKAMDVNAARQEIGMDLTAYGLFTGTFTVWDEDDLRADSKLAAGMQVFANAGFKAYAETEHMFAAWLSSHPGNRKDNVRKTLQSTRTLAHLAPGLNAVWPGPERDEYLDEEAWFWAQTEGSNIFRVVNHVPNLGLRDLGMYLMLGMSGSGKSTLGNFLRAMWMRKRHKQAKLFDLDGHGRLLTYLLGGQWYDIGAPGMRFQPLRYIDDPLRRAIALEWLLGLMEDFEVPRDAIVQACLGGGMRELAKRPPRERTISGLLTVMADMDRETGIRAQAGKITASGESRQDGRLMELMYLKANIRAVLKRFTMEGEYEGIFDGNEEIFDDTPVQTFEISTLINSRPSLVKPVLRHVLTHVDAQMTTDRPMLLQFGDAAIPLAIPQLQKQAKEWLTTRRKKGVSIGFDTHSLQQIFDSPLGVLLEENCPHRFFMPNIAALSKNIGDIYRRLGLTENAILSLATLRPQQDVLYNYVGLGTRSFSLPLTPFELDCLARNDEQDHVLMETLLAQEGREGFAAAWLRACGYKELANELEQRRDHENFPAVSRGRRTVALADALA